METVEMTVRGVWEITVEADESSEFGVRVLFRNEQGIFAQVNVEATERVQLAMRYKDTP